MHSSTPSPQASHLHVVEPPFTEVPASPQYHAPIDRSRPSPHRTQSASVGSMIAAASETPLWVIPVSIPVIPVIRTRIQVMASPCLGRCQRQPAHRCAPPCHCVPLVDATVHAAALSAVCSGGHVRRRRRRLRIGGHLTCAVPSTTTWSSCRPPPRPCSSGTCWYGPLWPLSTVEYYRVL